MVRSLYGALIASTEAKQRLKTFTASNRIGKPSWIDNCQSEFVCESNATTHKLTFESSNASFTDESKLLNHA
jgi:hypothetical protein